jgi:hypothetical protein
MSIKLFFVLNDKLFNWSFIHYKSLRDRKFIGKDVTYRSMVTSFRGKRGSISGGHSNRRHILSPLQFRLSMIVDAIQSNPLSVVSQGNKGKGVCNHLVDQ